MTHILNSQLIAKSYTNENEDINMPFTVQEVAAAIILRITSLQESMAF